jgi:antagonist of KipI
MGGLDGRALKAGDRLPLESPKRGRESFSGPARQTLSGAARQKKTPVPFLIPDRIATVRVMVGPHDQRFHPGALETLQSAPYVIGQNSDRMGFRLEGSPLMPNAGPAGASAFISDATPLGSIQVPTSGQPILLMADRQTTGGYPTLATVITADIGMAGQLGPGDSLAFVVCSHREAMAALVDRERVLMAIEAAA